MKQTEGVNMNNQNFFSINELSKSVDAASYGVRLTVDGDDYLISTVRNRKYIFEKLPMFCTSEARLKAHLVGFCSNVGK
jgi:hypothetical protein